MIAWTIGAKSGGSPNRRVGPRTSAGLWPVIDPSLPAKERRRLTRNQDFLVSAKDQRRRRPGTLLGAPEEGIWWMTAAIMLLLMMLLGAYGHAVQGLILTGIIGIFVLLCRVVEHPAARAARIHHGRYLLFEDFDEESRALLSRAGAAIHAVRGSLIGEVGLLDTVHDSVVLPHQLWEIAESLRRQTVLRAHQRDVTAANRAVRITADESVSRQRGAGRPIGSELDGILASHRRILALSVADTTRRVRALETYAERVRAADCAYADQQRRSEALDRSEDYQDLLVRIDESATTEILELAEHADRIEAALRRDIDGT